ncbi:LuxR family transcriptional regulator [Sphingomonas sp. Root50]|nr:LuxR family transcriptional regulator [Sphingomonas sp. Root1294]KQY65859.1 LuxR family transcriptional regulator [Sphingomonas sp. Root50]KRB95563.1 LuxR family transcriptional regulator [Sphingomonas sp. Root720]
MYRPGQVDVREYPAAIAERIIGQGTYRRDPVFRGCMFADSAFIWSKLNTLIAMDRRDRATLEFGLSHGLNEGITVPCNKLGYCLGSATFAGKISAEQAEKLIGLVQMIGVFAFKHARELAGEPIVKGTRPRLNPRPRDCVALVARGLSNKQIARALNLAPRTVDGYLRDGYRLFNAANRAELLAAAVLAGEIGTDELK